MSLGHVTRANGNVFADLGFSREEAANLKIRSALMIEISRIIESRGMKQVEAAKLFGVTQPRISDLVGEQIDVFTIDSLVNMLAHAGVRVEVTVGGAA